MSLVPSDSLPKARSLKIIGGGLAAGWVIWMVGFAVLGDFWKAVHHPAPLVYTEGVMMWASRELDNGHSPYGAIGNLPSRYFCYGPAVPLMAATAAGDGPSYLRAGRILSGAALVGAAVLCGILAGMLGGGVWGGSAAGLFFLFAVFFGHHAWSFRVDTSVVALGTCGAVGALAHLRGGGSKWLLLAFACGILGGATKFTSCFWGVWIFLLCDGGRILEDALRFRQWRRACGGMGGVAAFGIGWLAGISGTEFFYPGAVGDQVFSQAGSGLNPWGYTRNTIVDAFSLTFAPWIAAVGGAILGGGWRLVGVAGAAWMLAMGMLLKFGSDINYFFDGFALLAVAGGVGMAKVMPRYGGVAATAAAVASFLLMGAKENMPHRLKGSAADWELVAAREGAYLFRGKPILCEDPFFPVYHGGEVIVSDPFQASLSPEFSENARKSVKDSGRIVAGERLGRALGGELWGNFVGGRWTGAAGAPGVAVYIPDNNAQEVRRRWPRLKFQAVPGEVRFFAAKGEVLDWEAVAEAFDRLGGGRQCRLVGEDENPLEYRIFSGDGGTRGW